MAHECIEERGLTDKRSIIAGRDFFTGLVPLPGSDAWVWLAWRRRHARGISSYWACNDCDPTSLTTGGGFHLPVRASDLGAYSRIVRLNGPFGAGSQFASMSSPGLSF